MQKKKLYIISGLGADFTVLERIKFPAELEVIFLEWLIPEKRESLSHYVNRFAERIDDSQPFFLLGYSFGGIIAQEINRLKKAEKVVLLGSIKSEKEKSRFIKAGQLTRLPKILPTAMFNDRTANLYMMIRKMIDPKNPKLLQYFTVRNPYYLKWSIEQVSSWKFEQQDEVVQIMGDRDIVFPIRYCKPDFVIKGGSHLFPATRSKEVSEILAGILK